MSFIDTNHLDRTIEHCQFIEKRLIALDSKPIKIEQIRAAIRLLRSAEDMDLVLAIDLIRSASSTKEEQLN